MAVRRATIFVVLAVAALVSVEPVAAKDGLRQLPGKQGCLIGSDPPLEPALPLPETAPRGCSPIRGLGLDNLTVQFSRGGRTVYVTGESGIAVFDRDTPSGALRQLDGAGGCLTVSVRAGCASAGIGLANAEAAGLRVAPDGRHAYLSWGRWEDARSGGIAAFSVDPLTGALTPVPGLGGCLRTDGGTGCGALRELEGGPGLVVSPDGRHVYASGYDDRTVAILERDPATGGLTQPEGVAGCISARRRADCTRTAGPFLISGLSFSPRGKHAYAATGLNCFDEDVPCRPGSVVAFARSATTGMLARLRGQAGCYRYRGRGGCSSARAVFDAGQTTTTADGRYVYTRGLNGIAVFRRHRHTGKLTQLPGRSGCIQRSRREGCAKLRGIRTPSGIETSPDGRRVYIGTTFDDKAIAVFRRTRHGRLVQLPGRRGCVSRPRRAGCLRARISDHPYAVHVAPDGRHAYVDGAFVVAAFALDD